jgi:hypothetical protein
VELQQRLWPVTFVEETNLASLVVEIRPALRDTASHPVFVRTIYGHGYRFVGPLTEDDGPPLSGRPLATPGLVVDNREVILLEGANIIGRAFDATVSNRRRNLRSSSPSDIAVATGIGDGCMGRRRDTVPSVGPVC